MDGPYAGGVVPRGSIPTAMKIDGVMVSYWCKEYSPSASYMGQLVVPGAIDSQRYSVLMSFSRHCRTLPRPTTGDLAGRGGTLDPAAMVKDPDDLVYRYTR